MKDIAQESEILEKDQGEFNPVDCVVAIGPESKLKPESSTEKFGNFERSKALKPDQQLETNSERSEEDCKKTEKKELVSLVCNEKNCRENGKPYMHGKGAKFCFSCGNKYQIIETVPENAVFIRDSRTESLEEKTGTVNKTKTIEEGCEVSYYEPPIMALRKYFNDPEIALQKEESPSSGEFVTFVKNISEEEFTRSEGIFRWGKSKFKSKRYQLLCFLAYAARSNGSVVINKGHVSSTHVGTHIDPRKHWSLRIYGRENMEKIRPVVEQLARERGVKLDVVLNDALSVYEEVHKIY